MKPALQKIPPGLVYVFTGNGKGKTSAALGTALRGVALGWKVDWVAWYKNAQWDMSEYKLPDLLDTKSFSMFALGKGFYIQKPEKILRGTVKIASVQSAKVIDTETPDDHMLAAQAALLFAKKRLALQPEILVLDEICNAVNDQLLPESAVLELIQQRGKTHLILTGRQASPAIQDAADLVSEVVSRKHPYDSGKLAVAGLDF